MTKQELQKMLFTSEYTSKGRGSTTQQSQIYVDENSKINDELLPMILSQLTWIQARILVYMMMITADCNNDMVVLKSHSKIAQEIDVPKGAFEHSFRELVEKKILERRMRGVYYLNPKARLQCVA